MAQHRRRHHYYNRLRSLLPLLSAISGLLLVLFGLLTVLVLSPIDSDSRPQPCRYQVFDDENDGAFGTPAKSVFQVTSAGRRSDKDIWISTHSKYFYGCSNANKSFLHANVVTVPDRYLLIATSGGLKSAKNWGCSPLLHITDAFVAAWILNSTLVVPRLGQKSYWKDASEFSEIFDVDWFISSVSNNVKIIKALPKTGGKTWTTHSMRVTRKCSERCYQNRVLPAIQLTKFDYRLANKLDTQLLKLRCKVNYHALKFTDPILNMGKKLVQRMRRKSKHYIALHPRFVPDILAFSGCYYRGGGDKERKDLGDIRRRWKTLHIRNPDKERRHGTCPLSPKEVGLMLRALGYGSDGQIYVASGEVYGGEETLAPLRSLFPHFYTKDTLANKEELEPFSGFSSRMAALDLIVCDESDVFVTNNNGNMAKILAGRRRYFGHKRTIRPKAKKLYRLFLNESNMTWEAFASKVRKYHMGDPNEIGPGRGEFHENPHTCICEDSDAGAEKGLWPRKFGIWNNAREDSVLQSEEQNADEPELPEPDNDGDQDSPEEEGLFNGTGLDYDGMNSEEPELDEMLVRRGDLITYPRIT
ncbi:hypothetical protein K2173_007424 [Erythroxylum novogranatense]|uniref:O-fucosyltransferase family protein n=1 Tax=Erythroxylum novogranatense TaxID=1862640 RepID=A0AAV8T6N6_9ROSI|nr:hypothetical protein K2173_007424 [Erythroxylum novogranatense]